MKKHLLHLLTLGVMLFAFACGQNNKPIEDNLLTLSPDTPIVFDVNGGSRTIAVSTTLPSWTVVSNQSWCVVAKALDGKSFTVTAVKYSGSASQSEATILVAATDGVISRIAQIIVKQNGTMGLPFTITNSKITASAVNVAITPADLTAPYFFNVVSKATLVEKYASKLEDYVQAELDEALESCEGNVDIMLAEYCLKGEQSQQIESLSPKTDYVTFAVGVGADGKLSTVIVEQPFTTSDNSVSMTFQINEGAVYYDGFDFDVFASNETHDFYVGIYAASFYKGLTDAQLLEKIVDLDGFQIPDKLVKGIYKYKNDGGWNTGTDYLIVVFGYADGAPSTVLTKFVLKTQVVPVTDRADFRFLSKTVMSRSVQMVVTPAIDKAMYVTSYIDEATYNLNKAAMSTYVDNYVSKLSAFDFYYLLRRGERLEYYHRVLQPDTKYHTWAAYVDQDGKIIGEVTVSEVFKTVEQLLSDAVVEVKMGKYFNGDDLYAKDPFRYAKAKGKAYVTVDYVANTVSVLHYGRLQKESTAGKTYAELTKLLMGDESAMLPFEVNYNCDWDTQYTALAVAMDRYDDLGPLVDTKYTFTKAGASPIADFE